MSKSTFILNAQSGYLFAGATNWKGQWSETGGAATHDLTMEAVDDKVVVTFRKKGAKNATRVELVKAVDDPLELAARSHKGYVIFKGNKLHLWHNYAKGHDGDEDHERYDLKPRARAARPI